MEPDRVGLAGYSQEDHLGRLGRLSHDTAGLSLLAIEDLLQQAAVSTAHRLHLDEVMRLKRDRLRQESQGLIEVIQPRRGLEDIGGYPELKERLRSVVSALLQAKDPLVRSTLPMGILFVGPPGIGKSITAEALAGESGINLVKLGDFRGMYVGESERNLSRLFGLLETLYPAIVFVDEMDQALGRREQQGTGDSGVDRRVFGRLLEFMSDTAHRGRILWIGASNYPNNIDPAMKRAGRFDLVVPFLLPDRDSRKEILRLQLSRWESKAPGRLPQLPEPAELDRLAALTDGFSGAELEAVVGETVRRLVWHTPAARAAAAEPLAAAFERVLAAYRLPDGVRREYEKMTRLALAEVSYLDTLPPSLRGGQPGSILPGGPGKA